MIQLNTVPHDTNFAHIIITRVGDSRNTRYQVSRSEANLESAAQHYDSEAAVLASDFLRRKYGDHARDQTKE
jgi:hypothetical protein